MEDDPIFNPHKSKDSVQSPKNKNWTETPNCK